MENLGGVGYSKNVGGRKYISDPDKSGYIYKIFKYKGIAPSLDEQKRIIETKSKYFGEYMPKTILQDLLNGEYFIKQRYIEGKALAEVDISNLSIDTLKQLLDLIKRYLEYCKQEGVQLDLTGYQHNEDDPHCLRRKIKDFLNVTQNFLLSTNIIISNTGHVYMVDVCEAANSHLLGKFKNLCARPFIRKTVSQLEKILQEKISLENKSNEIFNTLNTVL